MVVRRWRALALVAMLLGNVVHGAEPARPAMLDLAGAVLLPGPGLGPKAGALNLIQAEGAARLGLNEGGLWGPIVRDWAEAKGRALIAIGTRQEGLDWTGPFAERLKAERGPVGPEGYQILIDANVPAVVIVGNDARGALFGVGRLLRELRHQGGRALLPTEFHAASAPQQSLRGHQLGYRAKTNSYDGWDRADWMRYIRELAVFGANAIELVPPRTDDDLDSPHFPLPPLRMMTEMSQICDHFDLDVWLWFPVMGAVDIDPSKIDPLLQEWDEVFRKLPRLDAVFVPGGDPGKVPPKPLFAFLERAAEVLHKTHPKATIWVSPQGFDAVGMDEFLALARARPLWLHGIVFGPQVRMPLAELRQALPARYPIRGYPDITHSRQCQHPVPDWDLAFACTEGREAINPRPRAQAALCRAYRADTLGFISYSEGCNDDVNKAVWSACAWGPDADADVADVLRQYGRYFLGEKYADSLAQALLGLERNWGGPLLTNAGVETTLHQLQDMERAADPVLRRNWRFQQALYRGYYDAYLRARLIQETALQAAALDALSDAPRAGSEPALRRASAILDRGTTEPVALDRRARVFELGEALFQSIKMQLSVEKYQAIEAERGANLNTIDTPLNDRVWLNREFARLRAIPTEPERLRALDALLNRTDPGPGGFYDAPGDPSNSLHLVRAPTTTADPLFVAAPFHGFALRDDWPMNWRRYIQAFYDAPLRFTYEGLDPLARYKVRVVYAGDSPRAGMRLEADGVEVHPLLPKPEPVRPVEFPLPAATTADGRLTLTFTGTPGRGGNGRGCQVAELWIVKEGR